VVGKGPEDVAFDRNVVDLLVGQDLVDGVAPEVAVAKLGGALGVVVELEDDLADVVLGDSRTVGERDVFGRAVVDEIGVVEAEGAGAVGVDGAGDPAVEVIVGILDDLSGRAGGARALGDTDQPVAVVPLVLDHLAGGDLGAEDAVVLGIVLVVVDAVGEKLVVVADDVTAADAVAVFVVPGMKKERAAFCPETVCREE